jgi:hypothetical protein
MNESTPDFYRKLHDVGIFMIGISAIITSLFYVFHRSAEDKIKLDAMRMFANGIFTDNVNSEKHK